MRASLVLRSYTQADLSSSVRNSSGRRRHVRRASRSRGLSVTIGKSLELRVQRRLPDWSLPATRPSRRFVIELPSKFDMLKLRIAGPALDIERALNKLEKVALQYSRRMGRPPVLIFNNIHFFQNDEEGRNMLLQLQQRAEAWAASGRFFKCS